MSIPLDNLQPALTPPLLNAPRIPTAVRIYALIIMLLNGITAFKIIANFTVVAITSRVWTWKMFGLGFSYYLAFLAFPLIWVRLGYGLRIGQRKAVYGIVCFSAINVLLSFFFYKSGSIENAAVGLFVLFAINIPVLISAFRHWNSFK